MPRGTSLVCLFSLFSLPARALEPAQGLSPQAHPPRERPISLECGTRFGPDPGLALPPGGSIAGTGPVFLPLAFHIVRQTDGSGGLDPSVLCSSFNLLQSHYAPTSIQFFLAGPVDFIDDDAFYFSTDTTAEINALRQVNTVSDAINIYCTLNLVQNGNPICGISSVPTFPFPGIVVANQCMPPGNGTTLTHEVGHFLSLAHTFSTSAGVELVDGSNCATAGDLVCDTPADPLLGDFNVNPPPACTYFGSETDPNGDPYNPDPSNFMTFGWRDCRTNFTPGQGSRMNAAINIFYASLINGPQPPSLDCDLNGLADECEILVGSSADLDLNGVPDICEVEIVVPTLPRGGLALLALTFAAGGAWVLRRRARWVLRRRARRSGA